LPPACMKWAAIAQSVQPLDTVRGSNPGKGQDFSHASRPFLWPTQPPVHLVPGLFRGGKAAGVTTHPHLAQVKETVELYVCSPCGLSWYVIGSTLPLKSCMRIVPFGFQFAVRYVCTTGVCCLLCVQVTAFVRCHQSVYGLLSLDGAPAPGQTGGLVHLPLN